MSIKKQFLKTRPVCKVTFRLSRDDARDAQSACLAGDFNGWNKSGVPMKRLKNGSFSLTLDLATGKDYQFRYLIDGHTWVNDPRADRYVSSGFGDSDNFVVSV
ncbi:MAG TPA: glycoside hydrolase [Desulfobacteraceae bacterium]|nr:isoamylase early set domain-containing protein [Deltaproteobacteria bacterium]RLB95439.1 MAG: glycoside hydrolase [Deltaproteobacteria bacterium]HDI59484.1 glycoside hydrolase [Desulfobacteraceae bacterium]